MNPVRAFIAIEIPIFIQEQLRLLISPLTRFDGSPVRWVRSENIHLTVKFLGDSEPDDLEKLAGLLKKSLSEKQPFQIRVGGFGAFPSLNRPRVFWCGVEKNPELQTIAAVVEETSSRLGFEPENRPFSPHLTLGRSNERSTPRDNQNIASAIRGFPDAPLGKFDVDKLVIFRSQLNRGGSIYTPLYQIPFGEAII